MAQFVKGASITEQFRDFGRGVLSLSGLVFFLSIILLNLYLSMVLIGRRHWVGGTGGRAMTIHFIVRSLALVASGGSLIDPLARPAGERRSMSIGQVAGLAIGAGSRELA